MKLITKQNQNELLVQSLWATNEMNSIRKILIILIVTIPFFVKGQTIEKTYKGCWAYCYTFNFHSNGTYKVTSDNIGLTVESYGNVNMKSTFEGVYIIKGDTLELLSGFDTIYHTVNQFYLIDKDSMLIDIVLRYDFTISSAKDTRNYQSNIRKIKYPHINTSDKKTKKELEQILNLSFNCEEVSKYYQFDKYPNRTLFIANYYSLDKKSETKVIVNSKEILFLPKVKLKDNFYIDILDINQNKNCIDIVFKIEKGNIRFNIRFIKSETIWIMEDIDSWSI